MMDVLAVVTRWALFGGLATLVGAALFRGVVLRGEAGEGVGKAGEGVAATAGLISSVLILLASLARLPFQVVEFLFPGESVKEAATFLVTGTTWGRGWLLQVALALAAVGIWAGVRRWRGAGWWWGGGVTALALCVTPALGGHAIGNQDFRVLAVAADSLHVAAAGGWMGTLGVLLLAAFLVSRPAPLPPGLLARWVDRFSPVALGAVGTLVATGSLGVWLNLPEWRSLGTTTYGRTLLLKLCLVAGAFALGWENWRNVRPRLGRDREAEGSLRLWGGLELVVAHLVLLATAVLVALPPYEDHGHE